MGKSFYVQSYQAASRRWAQGAGDSESEWQEWVEALGKIKRAWKWSVDGMLTQLDREDPEIWHALGDAYLGGHGVERDVEQAEKWLRMAANAGNVRSMTRLGMLLFRDERSDEDKRESLDWYRRAAELGDSSGMISMGFAYREGRCEPVDEKKAVEWFIKAVEAGDSHSMIHAGRMYSRYLQRPVEAIRWFLRAAEAGHTESHLELAFLYEDRKSILYDAERAVHWYKRVEDGTSSSRDRARLALAHFCRNGEGTAHDPAEAKAWLRKVIESASPTSAFHREAKSLLPKWEAEML